MAILSNQLMPVLPSQSFFQMHAGSHVLIPLKFNTILLKFLFHVLLALVCHSPVSSQPWVIFYHFCLLHFGLFSLDSFGSVTPSLSSVLSMNHLSTLMRLKKAEAPNKAAFLKPLLFFLLVEGLDGMGGLGEGTSFLILIGSRVWRICLTIFLSKFSKGLSPMALSLSGSRALTPLGQLTCSQTMGLTILMAVTSRILGFFKIRCFLLPNVWLCSIGHFKRSFLCKKSCKHSNSWVGFNFPLKF